MRSRPRVEIGNFGAEAPYFSWDSYGADEVYA
jgi:hypothetical protein